jgi:predicted RNA-binding protein with TRAM domain
MANCPLADDCPSFSERIKGMGCQHYGDRGGAEWCNHYEMPIRELKQQPIKVGEEVVVDVTDMHESGAGVGRTEDGFIVFVDGLLPEARAVVRIDRVLSNHAKANEVVERLPMDGDEETDSDSESDDGETVDSDVDDESDVSDDTEDDESSDRKRPDRDRLGSRENFWGS